MKNNSENREYVIANQNCIKQCNTCIQSCKNVIDAVDKKDSNIRKTIEQTVSQCHQTAKFMEQYIKAAKYELEFNKKIDTEELQESISKAGSVVKKCGEIIKFSERIDKNLTDACSDCMEICDELLESCENILG